MEQEHSVEHEQLIRDGEDLIVDKSEITMPPHVRRAFEKKFCDFKIHAH